MRARLIRFLLVAVVLLGLAETAAIAAPQPKASGDGLQLVDFTWRIADGRAYVTVGGIRNDSATRATGWLRLRLFASLQMPSPNEAFSGYPVATFAILPPLDPGGRHVAQVFEAPLALTPQPGRYWMRLALYEWSPSLCGGNAWPEWCSIDDRTATAQWIVPPGTDLFTVVVPGATFCIENATGSVVEQLRATNTQLDWVSRPARVVTCEHQGMTHFAGFLRNASYYSDVTPVVYTFDHLDAYLLCRFGTLADCTAAAPAVGAFTGQWWNAEEPGWGLSLSHASRNVIFAVWFVYDTRGEAHWYTAECWSFALSCLGTLYETRGPPVGPSFDPSRVTIREAGTMRIEFVGTQQATMHWTLEGKEGSRAIARQTY